MLSALLASLALAAPLQEAAPAETARANDPKAVTLMKEFHAQLYDPVAQGLKQMSFDMIMPNPMAGGSMGVLSVSWRAGQDPQASFEPSEAMLAMVPAEMHGQMKEQMAAQMDQVGQQMIEVQINGFVQSLLDDMFVTLEGVEEGFIKVSCEARPGVETAGGSRTLYFDDEGRFARSVQKVESPMGSMEQVATMSWEPVHPDSDRLVLASSLEKAGGMQQTSRFERTQLGGFHLVTAIVGSGMGPETRIEFQNFVVNGENVGAAAATPAAGGAEGAASEG